MCYRLLIIAATLFSLTVYAQTVPIPGHDEHSKPPEQRDSSLTWEELNDLDIRVEVPAPLQSIMHVSFSDKIKARDGQQVTIKGFMYPLKAGETHDYFLLSAFPPSCPFCLPGGQTTLIEVSCREPVEYTMEPIQLRGRFALLDDDPSGLYYRMTEAHAADH